MQRTFGVWLVLCGIFVASCASHKTPSRTFQPASPFLELPRVEKPAEQPAPEPAIPGQTTVVWISIDGMRFDYLNRIHPITLSRMAAQGAFTTQEMPIFPSLTFPNHIAQVTGVHVDRNGVPSNSFYDSATQQTYNFPDQASLIRAEPIWSTATRQGVRTAVIDWPMSHSQSGPNKAAYFGDHFDPQETDQHRLDRVVALLNADHADKPPRLVMTYVSQVDTVGHQSGPDSPAVADAVKQVDSELQKFGQSVLTWFNATHAPQDDLVMLFTADHGMEPVDLDVNLDRLLGGPLMAGAKILTSGPMATIQLIDVPNDQKPARIKQIVEKLKQNEFLSAWPSHEVPAGFHFDDPSRVGDVVAMLLPGFTFTSQRMSATAPHIAGPKGMHGYDPAVCPNMLGMAVVWRYRHPIGGRDLGPIDNTQWQATVAMLLGIEPAAGSDPRPVKLP